MTYEEALSLAQSYGDSLEHHGIRGMKHGRRRFQNEDGTWTEAGLEARRKREGFAERRQVKKEARAAKRAERKAAMAKSYADYKEQKRKNSLKGMTDEELEKKIARLKLENEYKELNKSQLVKSGEKFIENYLKNRQEKAERAYTEKQTKATREHEMAKLKELTEQAKIRAEADKERAKADVSRAEADKKRAETDRIDIEKGTRLVKLKNERKNLKLQGKRFVSDNTVRGGIKKLLNKVLSGKGTASEETSLEKGFARGIVKAQNKIDRHNRWHKQSQLPMDPNPWDRVMAVAKVAIRNNDSPAIV